MVIVETKNLLSTKRSSTTRINSLIKKFMSTF
nr:MAG TPA: hypothetical protein [Caudoviricetes sp.]